MLDPLDQQETVDVSILIVGYNSHSYLASCISAIEGASRNTNKEVLFVNNGDDNSEKLVERDFPFVRILEPAGNTGFASANNRLARHAAGRFLILLNPDTELEEGAIDRLVDTAVENPDYRILGGLSRTPGTSGGPYHQQRLPRISNYLRSIIGQTASPLELDHTKDVVPSEMVNGGFMLVDAEIWRELGGFDDGFFLYAEDADLCRRASEIGAKVGVAPGAWLLHDLGSGSVYSPLRRQLMAKGAAHYFRKHYPRPRLWLALAAMWAAAISRFAFGSVAGVRSPRYRAMARGFRPLALKPWIWMKGYEGKADPRRSPQNNPLG